jgi:uncharacterized phage-like protein YoqJ
MVTIAITGHRPEDLQNFDWIRETLASVLKEENPDLLYQGMAAGADLLAAQVSYELGIPYVATKPWAGHSPRTEDRVLYQEILDRAESIVEVDPDEDFAGVWVYHNRNKYMVDHADLVVAIWNGKETGGTATCTKYARDKGKLVIQINPATQEVIYPDSVTLF